LKISSALPRASFVIEGSGHNMMGEKPDDVLDALTAFLE
jgi:pimeloyl-ACP methyl ester carboxylesterase